MSKEGKRCLIDELVLNKGKNVMIGVRSSFFYVGPSEEALNELDIIGLLAKFCVPLTSKKDVTRQIASSSGLDIGGREVLKSYPRGGGETVIIIEGREFGAFWTRDEYLSGRKMLIEALGKSKTGK